MNPPLITSHDQLQNAFIAYKRSLSKPPIVFPEIMASHGPADCRFDALCMEIGAGYRPILHGYEVKHRRADFDSDIDSDKWRKYPATGIHYFSFVVPAGLVKKEEIPESVGLVVWQPEKGVFRQIVKAQRLTHDTPSANFMTRLVLRAEEQRREAGRYTNRTRLERMAEYVHMHNIGWIVQGRVRSKIMEAEGILDRIAHERNQLARDREQFEAMKAATDIAPEVIQVVASLMEHAAWVASPHRGSLVDSPDGATDSRREFIDAVKSILPEHKRRRW